MKTVSVLIAVNCFKDVLQNEREWLEPHYIIYRAEEILSCIYDVLDSGDYDLLDAVQLQEATEWLFDVIDTAQDIFYELEV